ncbi:hypothetical protein ABZX62_27460 [Streptomyces flavidovirens]|uniref:hypothetical protein n=1 Tax=Streptomyces flavidovirens TaxID=67298 RepID=UPI0033A78387
MRKTISTFATGIMMVGLLTITGTEAVAVQPAPRAVPLAAQAQCVKVVRFYNKRFNRVVEVKNSCERKACFTVTVPARRDPQFAVGAKKKQSFQYGGIAWTKGTGVKNVAC